MKKDGTAIVWFRRDLRLADNPALAAASARYVRVVPVYIHAPAEEAPWQPGAASRWWLHHSLEALAGRLRGAGSRLLLRHGAAEACLERLIGETGATGVYWNRLYEPSLVSRDTALKIALRRRGIDCRSFKAAVLFEPWEIATGAGQPYRVFTAFWKKCLPGLSGLESQPAPARLPSVAGGLSSIDTGGLKLLPRIPWDGGLGDTWAVGEEAAQRRLDAFLADALGEYSSGRDLPGQALTSRLSPHLHFGEIGPRQVVERLAGPAPHVSEPALAFLRELVWREFAHHLLYHFPDTADQPLNPKFADFPWRDDQEGLLAAWQQGRTGIPMVDAGMRELWRTGWMHNRVRMIVGSFLTKNLRLPWQLGARWFWDTLVDADLASNTLGWQWVAGCGADAAPYFRIFNPVTQAGRFDPQGRYLRRWLPELGGLPVRHLAAPWEAPGSALREAQLRLGSDYPLPIVDLKRSREEALAAYQRIR